MVFNDILMTRTLLCETFRCFSTGGHQDLRASSRTKVFSEHQKFDINLIVCLNHAQNVDSWNFIVN